MNQLFLVLFTLCIASIDIVLGQGCKQCVVDGRTIGGNTVFTRTDGCTAYTWCLCDCYGIWNCPVEHARNRCQQNESTSCLDCSAKGQRIKGNSKFTYQERCNEYDCFCNCDGGWNCPNDQIIDICNTDPNTGCRTCNVYGQRKKAQSRFDLTDLCWSYVGCICNCDGRWTCAEATKTNICGD